MTSRELDALALELDLAARDARDVEQIVDEARAGAATWRSMTPRSRASASPRSSHQLERGEDRRERVAQLVAEHREELVLRAVRLSASARAACSRSSDDRIDCAATDAATFAPSSRATASKNSR